MFRRGLFVPRVRIRVRCQNHRNIYASFGKLGSGDAYMRLERMYGYSVFNLDSSKHSFPGNDFI